MAGGLKYCVQFDPSVESAIAPLLPTAIKVPFPYATPLTVPKPLGREVGPCQTSSGSVWPKDDRHEAHSAKGISALMTSDRTRFWILIRIVTVENCAFIIIPTQANSLGPPRTTLSAADRARRGRLARAIPLRQLAPTFPLRKIHGSRAACLPNLRGWNPRSAMRSPLRRGG